MIRQNVLIRRPIVPSKAARKLLLDPILGASYQQDNTLLLVQFKGISCLFWELEKWSSSTAANKFRKLDAQASRSQYGSDNINRAGLCVKENKILRYLAARGARDVIGTWFGVVDID